MTKPAKRSPPDALLGQCKVCAKKIRASEDHLKVYYGGIYHLVCCASCAAKFEANPQQYVVF